MPGIRNIKSDATSAGTVMSLADYFARTQQAVSKDPAKQGTPQSRLSRGQRSSWAVTCKSWMQTGKAIDLYVNPSSVQWSMPRRGASVKTAAGTVRNVWRNRFRNTYYDEAEITLTFQAGNIMPVMGYEGVDLNLSSITGLREALLQGAVPPGLRDFYSFLELLDQPQTLGPAENNHVLVYRSRVFPKLYLEGFFKDETPVAWTDQAGDSGNSVEWTAGFTIYNSFPRFGSAAQMMQVYRDWISAEGAVEAIPYGSATAADLADYKAQKVLSNVETAGSSIPANPKQGRLVTEKGKTEVQAAAGVTPRPPVSGSIFQGVPLKPPAPNPQGTPTTPQGTTGVGGTGVSNNTWLALGGG